MHLISAVQQAKYTAQPRARANGSAMILIQIYTPLGTITAALGDVRAPITVANFLRYLDAGYYTGGEFWRTVRMDNQPDVPVKIEVVQADANPARKEALFDPIPLERTSITGLSHLDGTFSMSRFAPDSARSSFFICIGDQPELNFGGARNPDGQGFAAFGRVTSGMDVVCAIQMSPSSIGGGEAEAAYRQIEFQRLTPPVPITSITRRQ
jgi:peptidyl-prolyl cis-trans isomerase A (cyclophilin A)